MGTTTSSLQTTDDVNSIIAGMGQAPQTDRARAPLYGQLPTPLPPSLQPGYQAPLPTALQPQPDSNLPVPPQNGDQRNYTVTGTGPGTWWRQQQGTDPRSRTPDEYHLGQPIWHPRPGEQGYQPGDLAINQPPQMPRYGLGAQPGPWPQAYPNSPVYTSANAPALPGETQQETAALNNFMARESQGRNVMNDRTAKDPSQYGQGHTDQGYWQIVNSTWQDGARRAGVSLQQYPTAMSAPYEVQRQVALALYRSYGDKPWAASAGAGEHGDRFQLANQQLMQPMPRGYNEWGRDPPGFGMSQPGAMPQRSDFGSIMGNLAPLLVGIASLALRMPLSASITAYSAMERARQNGQNLEYERNRTRMQDQLKESTAQQTMESRDASDAFAAYGENNPQGLQQALAQIALKYNDPIMYRMAQQGDLNGIHKLQAQRDMYNQNLTKMNKAVEEEQERRDVAADVAARDKQWDQEHPNATPEERAIAHAQHRGQAEQDVAPGKAGQAGEQEGAVRDVIGPDGQPTGQQVRTGRGGGYFDPDTKQPVHLKPGERTLEPSRERPEGTGPKPSDYKDYTWDDPEGRHHGPSSAAMVPGKGLVDPTGNPIPAKPETIRSVSTATPSPVEGYPHEAGTQPYEGKPNRPPPDTNISEGVWRQALTYVNTGKSPSFARDRQSMAQFREVVPVAMRAMGVTEEEMDRRWVQYSAYRTRENRIESAFAGGQDGKTMIALNTIAHHINLFRQYADAMQNNDYPAMNRVVDDLARAGGATELTDFNIVSRVTGDELVRVLTGTGGGTITDREDIARQLSVYSSPDQFRGAADTLTNVLRGRFLPLQQAYARGDPQKEQYFQNSMMVPEARQMFTQPQLPIQGAPVQPMTEQQYNAAPSGTRYRMPNDPPDTVRIKP